ncbi:MAG TPA: ABC transporter permease [Phycisphaerae bacterium]|jgi:ABC-type transport system involved in multi-copper enzyme maturation permease subunit
MMTQTLAILLDAYRELQSKKMFWVVLTLNLLAICGFAIIGANDHTITVLWFEPLGDMTAGGTDPHVLYKIVYSYFIVGFWLTWLASLLALISTAGIFPDFLSSGSVDLFLARPITRLRLFFTKYFAGMLFVTLQVSVFTVLSFLVLGIRAGIWQLGLLWAIPLVVLFFSYLFSICVLLGTLMRSTVAALLLTILAWFGIWAVDRGESVVLTYRQGLELRQAYLDDEIEAKDAQIAKLGSDPGNTSQLDLAKSQRNDLADERKKLEISPALTTAENVAFGIKSLVPKTRETINLLDRVLFTDKDLQESSKHDDAAASQPEFGPRRGGPRFEARRSDQIKRDRQRSVWWIIGTSLLFEAVVLALAAWHFCTRDF